MPLKAPQTFTSRRPICWLSAPWVYFWGYCADIACALAHVAVITCFIAKCQQRKSRYYEALLHFNEFATLYLALQWYSHATLEKHITPIQHHRFLGRQSKITKRVLTYPGSGSLHLWYVTFVEFLQLSMSVLESVSSSVNSSTQHTGKWWPNLLVQSCQVSCVRHPITEQYLQRIKGRSHTRKQRWAI